jgi:hypothetical protein
LHVWLALLIKTSPWHFGLGFESIGAMHSRIADPSAAPPTADYGKKVRLAIGYGLTAEGTEGFSQLT